MQRCGENINKRIPKLHASVQSAELRSDFTLALRAYVPEADIRVEFPGPTANHLLGRMGMDHSSRHGTILLKILPT